MEKTKFIPDFSNLCFTENGALTHKTSGKVLADQFGKAGSYRGRELETVFAEQAELWSEDELMALRFPFYLRMITRKTKVNDDVITEKVQKGQGARDEAFKRLLWVALKHKDAFYKNICFLPMVGSWKDLWTLLYYDVVNETNFIDHKIIYELINEGLKCKTHSELIKKFMPRIKTASKCKTPWTQITNMLAKEFANFNGLSYKQYNHLKTSGTAHDFQKLICSQRYKDINWNLIPGRALNNIATEKFLNKHDLIDNYTNWVMKQPTAKFTGYVYELGLEVAQDRENKMPLFRKMTIDKQFDELVKKATEDGSPLGNVWCALDTSGSMTHPVAGKVRAIDVCVSLGVFFSTLNTGAFHDHVVMFDTTSRPLKLEGSFSDKIRQIYSQNIAWGNTNFQSIVDLMVKIRKENPEIPLEDFPSTILVVSDMQFDAPYGSTTETNYEAMKSKLYEVFPTEFVDSMKFIWWDVVSRKKEDFPATLSDGGNYFFSGFDGSIITMLLGGEVAEIEKKTGEPITMEQIINAALGQEILSFVNV